MPDYVVVIRDEKYGTRFSGTTSESSEAAIIEALGQQPLDQVLNPESIIGIWVTDMDDMGKADVKDMTEKALGLGPLTKPTIVRL